MAATASLEVATGSPQVPWHGFKPGLWQKEVNVLNREMLLDAKSPFELPVWVRFVLVPGLTDAGAVRGRVRDLPCRGGSWPTDGRSPQRRRIGAARGIGRVAGRDEGRDVGRLTSAGRAGAAAGPPGRADGRVVGLSGPFGRSGRSGRSSGGTTTTGG